MAVEYLPVDNLIDICHGIIGSDRVEHRLADNLLVLSIEQSLVIFFKYEEYK